MNRSTPRPAAGLAGRIALLALLVAAGAGAAQAGTWKFSLTPYAWATGVGVDAKLGDRTLVDETIPVSDLLEDLDTMVSLRLEAKRDAFGAMVDVFDVTLSDELGADELAKAPGVNALEAGIGMTILDVAGTWDPQGDGQGFTYVYGIRLLNERGDADATLEPAPGTTVERSYDASETLVDALVGVRFDRTFARRFTWRMEADFSTGGTDFTWSVGPTLGWTFGENGRHALTAGWRRMQVDHEDDGDLETEMALSGLRLGLRYGF